MALPELSAVDYAQRPLNIGDKVTLISDDGVTASLCTGTIRLIERDQLCIWSGHLLIRKGKRLEAHRGAPERCYYPQVALLSGADQPAGAEASAG